MALFETRLQPLYLSYNQLAAGIQVPEPPTAVPISWSWSPEIVEQWLVDTGYGRYRCFFKKHGINGQSLLSLSPQKLRSMGIVDNCDALGIWSNAQLLFSHYRPVEQREVPGLPATFNRAICFGVQVQMPKNNTTTPICYNADLSPGPATLRRIWDLAGDRYGWYACNRPHPTL